MRPIIDAGIVDHIICWICLKIFTFVTNAAKFVVSESGDILSPNTPPAITTPATIPIGIFISLAIAINAIPAVPTDPHAVPVATDVTAVMKNAVTKKYVGLIVSNP